MFELIKTKNNIYSVSEGKLDLGGFGFIWF